MFRLVARSTVGRVQLERPQEVVGSLKVLPHGGYLVYEVLHADDVALLAERFLDHLVVGDRETLLVDLGETSLVDELANRSKVGVPPRHVGFDQPQHVQRGFVQPHKHTAVYLPQPEQLKCFLNLRRHLVHAADADHERELRTFGDVEVAGTFGHPLQAYVVAFSRAVLFHVFLGTLEHLPSFLFERFLLLEVGGGTRRAHAFDVLATF